MSLDYYDTEDDAESYGTPTPGPRDVVFTQYLRPNGRTRTVWITMPADVKALADVLVAKGCIFKCEELTTGHASLTVEPVDDRYDEGGPLAIEVVPNGPEVPAAVERLIRRAHERAQTLKA